MQTRCQSLIESIANILLGYGVAIAAQLVIFPLYGVRLPLADNLAIGAFFTVVSLVRGYFLRRLFNRWHARP